MLTSLGISPRLFGCQKFLRYGDNLIGLKAKFFLQLLERRRNSESMQADHTTLLAHITLPSEGRGLLDGHADLHVWRQHAVSILLCLVFENVPRRHRDH